VAREDKLATALKTVITSPLVAVLLQVSEAEKGRERERRQVAREDKLAAARAEHELRVARALERAAAPVFKKSGKPIMFRSRPPQRKVGRCSMAVPSRARRSRTVVDWMMCGWYGVQNAASLWC
jgi:hypothetical protein